MEDRPGKHQVIPAPPGWGGCKIPPRILHENHVISGGAFMPEFAAHPNPRPAELDITHCDGVAEPSRSDPSERSQTCRCLFRFGIARAFHAVAPFSLRTSRVSASVESISTSKNRSFISRSFGKRGASTLARTTRSRSEFFAGALIGESRPMSCFFFEGVFPKRRILGKGLRDSKT